MERKLFLVPKAAKGMLAETDEERQKLKREAWGSSDKKVNCSIGISVDGGEVSVKRCIWVVVLQDSTGNASISLKNLVFQPSNFAAKVGAEMPERTQP